MESKAVDDRFQTQSYGHHPIFFLCHSMQATTMSSFFFPFFFSSHKTLWLLALVLTCCPLPLIGEKHGIKVSEREERRAKRNYSWYNGGLIQLSEEILHLHEDGCCSVCFSAEPADLVRWCKRTMLNLIAYMVC